MNSFLFVYTLISLGSGSTASHEIVTAYTFDKSNYIRTDSVTKLVDSKFFICNSKSKNCKIKSYCELRFDRSIYDYPTIFKGSCKSLVRKLELGGLE